MKKLTYKNFRKNNYGPFLAIVLIAAFLFVTGICSYKFTYQDIKNNENNGSQAEMSETPEAAKKSDNEASENIEEIDKQADLSEEQKDKEELAQKQTSETKPEQTAATPSPVKKQVQSIPKNFFSSPEEYLSHVKNLLQNNLNTNYSIDCKALVNFPNSIKIIEDGWNGDVAYNFIGRYLNEIPKYYDSSGHAMGIVITFSGHSIKSVDFE